jgi:hypothetical protein
LFIVTISTGVKKRTPQRMNNRTLWSHTARVVFGGWIVSPSDATHPGIRPD